ncbi:hypothetical protein HDU76_011434 [Blyttiomyces sp. JEL0837]|nr:hypothetical protein HDU76_011434 [Blyttiomyces sp. JEL0837]
MPTAVPLPCHNRVDSSLKHFANPCWYRGTKSKFSNSSTHPPNEDLRSYNEAGNALAQWFPSSGRSLVENLNMDDLLLEAYTTCLRQLERYLVGAIATLNIESESEIATFDTTKTFAKAVAIGLLHWSDDLTLTSFASIKHTPKASSIAVSSGAIETLLVRMVSSNETSPPLKVKACAALSNCIDSPIVAAHLFDSIKKSQSLYDTHIVPRRDEQKTSTQFSNILDSIASKFTGYKACSQIRVHSQALVEGMRREDQQPKSKLKLTLSEYLAGNSGRRKNTHGSNATDTSWRVLEVISALKTLSGLIASIPMKDGDFQAGVPQGFSWLYLRDTLSNLGAVLQTSVPRNLVLELSETVYIFCASLMQNCSGLTLLACEASQGDEDGSLPCFFRAAKSLFYSHRQHLCRFLGPVSSTGSSQCKKHLPTKEHAFMNNFLEVTVHLRAPEKLLEDFVKVLKQMDTLLHAIAAFAPHYETNDLLKEAELFEALSSLVTSGIHENGMDVLAHCIYLLDLTPRLMEIIHTLADSQSSIMQCFVNVSLSLFSRCVNEPIFRAAAVSLPELRSHLLGYEDFDLLAASMLVEISDLSTLVDNNGIGAGVDMFVSPTLLRSLTSKRDFVHVNILLMILLRHASSSKGLLEMSAFVNTKSFVATDGVLCEVSLASQIVNLMEFSSQSLFFSHGQEHLSSCGPYLKLVGEVIHCFHNLEHLDGLLKGQSGEERVQCDMTECRYFANILDSADEVIMMNETGLLLLRRLITSTYDCLLGAANRPECARPEIPFVGVKGSNLELFEVPVDTVLLRGKTEYSRPSGPLFDIVPTLARLFAAISHHHNGHRLQELVKKFCTELLEFVLFKESSPVVGKERLFRLCIESSRSISIWAPGENKSTNAGKHVIYCVKPRYFQSIAVNVKKILNMAVEELHYSADYLRLLVNIIPMERDSCYDTKSVHGVGKSNVTTAVWMAELNTIKADLLNACKTLTGSVDLEIHSLLYALVHNVLSNCDDASSKLGYGLMTLFVQETIERAKSFLSQGHISILSETSTPAANRFGRWLLFFTASLKSIKHCFVSKTQEEELLTIFMEVLSALKVSCKGLSVVIEVILTLLRAKYR